MPSRPERARHLLLAALVGVACNSGCGGRIADPAPFFAAQELDVEGELLPTACGAAPCHDADQPASGLDLVSPGVAARLLGVASACGGRALIEAAPRQGSYLLEKVETSTPACGARMPFGGVLADAELIALQAWVAGVRTATVGE